MAGDLREFSSFEGKKAQIPEQTSQSHACLYHVWALCLILFKTNQKLASQLIRDKQRTFVPLGRLKKHDFRAYCLFLKVSSVRSLVGLRNARRVRMHDYDHMWRVCWQKSNISNCSNFWPVWAMCVKYEGLVLAKSNNSSKFFTFWNPENSESLRFGPTVRTTNARSTQKPTNRKPLM